MIKRILFLLLIVTFTLNLPVQNAYAAPRLSRAETYERFHDVLHPLQHEALPQKNFAEIRQRSSELVKRGKAIVALGVGQAPTRNRAEFAKALRSFDKALAKFKADARSGSDAKLEKSFAAVHDTYEELDALTVTVVHVDAGSVYIICMWQPKAPNLVFAQAYAYSPSSDRLAYRWSLDRGRISNGQTSATVIVDTEGLGDEMISFKVEVDDGAGHLMSSTTKCKVR